METLPGEIIYKIISYFEAPELLCWTQINKSNRWVLENIDLWATLAEKNFNYSKVKFIEFIIDNIWLPYRLYYRVKDWSHWSQIAFENFSYDNFMGQLEVQPLISANQFYRSIFPRTCGVDIRGDLICGRPTKEGQVYCKYHVLKLC